MSALRIKKTTAADLVTDRLKELVLSGKWAIDEKLPSEASLAELFGVNRLTVRIALQRLNALGVLETRDGEGTFVRRFNFGAHMKTLTDFLMTPELMASIGEYRIVLEGECVRLAAGRTTEADFECLEKLFEVFRATVDEYEPGMDPEAKDALFERTLDCTLDIHCEICRLSGNPLLAYAYEIAREPIRRYMRETAKNRLDDVDEAGRSPWVELHSEVIDAMKAKDPDRARACLELIIFAKTAEETKRR